MIIKCGICDKEIEVVGNIADGQHVACPYCGGTSEYKKPSRIELPTKKPKLGVRRPQPRQEDSPEACRANNLVQQVEARAKAQERKARAARRKALFNNVVALLVLAGLGWGGYTVWRSMKSGRALELPPAVSDLLEKAKPTADETESQEALEEEAAQEAERQRELARKRQREAEEAERRAAEKKRTQEYFAVRNGFSGAKLAYWGELPKEQRPGETEGTFGLVVPRGRGKCDYFQVVSRDGGVTVRRLSEKVPPQDVSQAEYEKMMTEHGGFFLKDGTAYFVTASGGTKTWMAPTSRNASFSPAKTLFDAAYPILDERLIDTKGRGFEVFFALSDDATPIRVGAVPFNGEIAYKAFADAAREILLGVRKKATPPAFKMRKVNRTVVFYDGSHIAKGMRGVTKIPRKWPTNRTDGLVEYARLRDEALRQEREIERAREEVQQAKAEWKAKMNKPPTDSEIQRVLYAGVVTIKRK